MIKIPGPWTLGYAFDVHTQKSEYIGDDQYERPRFNTVRSPMGQCLYNLKYNQQFQEIEKIMNFLLSEIIFKSFIEKIDVIIPAPPSNKNRRLQPVILIAQEIARIFQKELRQDIFMSSNFEEIKNIDTNEKYDKIKNNLIMEGQMDKSKNILLFDDVFDSGSTLTAMANTIAEKKYHNIFVFTLTKTRTSD